MAVAGKLLPGSREQSDQFWLQNTRDVQLPSAAGFGILLVESANPRHWLSAGRTWQRLQLWAALQGFALQPLDQSLQRADRETTLGLEPRVGRAVADLVNDRTWRAALPFCFGYPTQPAGLSPRRSVADVQLV